jgi:dienelactone hydrolase
MLIAYRGYSDSTGVPTERGLMNDGEAIVKHILEREDIDRSKIFLHGRSLGGAVASYVIT